MNVDEILNEVLPSTIPEYVSNPDNVITVKNLDIQYSSEGPRWSHGEANLRRSKIIALLGSNGEGKSTYVTSLVGINPKITYNTYDASFQLGAETFTPTPAAFEYSSEELLHLVDLVRYIGSPEILSGELTVKEYLYLASCLWHGDSFTESSACSRVSEFLSILDLEKYLDKPVSELSTGNRQKVNLVLSLFGSPELYIFDEPLSGLDIERRVDLKLLFKKYNKEFGSTIVIITHELSEFIDIVDELAVIKNSHMYPPISIENLNSHICTRTFKTPLLYKEKVEEILTGNNIECQFGEEDHQGKIPFSVLVDSMGENNIASLLFKNSIFFDMPESRALGFYFNPENYISAYK